MGLLTAQTVEKSEFQKSRWWAAIILQIVKWPYLRNRLAGFDEISQADATHRPLKIQNF